MKHFNIKELTKSKVAEQKGINNTPNKEIEGKLVLLIDTVLDPIRDIWGKPLMVNSGYRCDELNKAVGGKLNSQHLKGEAADLTTGSKSENMKLFEMIKNSGIAFGQLIDECNYSWIHISLGTKKQILHL